MRCDAVHPETKAQCVLGEGMHEYHTGTVPGSMPPEGVDWLNEDYQAPLKARTKAQRKEQKKDLAQRVRDNVRRNDPAQAHRASARFEPYRHTRKGQALAHLRSRPGQWIDAYEFTTDTTGGFSGTRRVRELREEGWPIEIRLRPGSDTIWQYRLLEGPEEA